MFKRWMALFLVLMMLLSGLPMIHGAERGVSISSDSQFFSKLNLNRKGLEAVKAAVSKSDFTTAKKALLDYYKTCFSTYEAKPFSTGTEDRVFMAMNDVVAFSEEYIDGQWVSSRAYEPYTFDLGGNLEGIYVLDQIYATTDGVAVQTSESSNPPLLSLYSSNGTLLKTIPAVEDTSVRPSKDLSAGYGSATVMYAKHWPDTKNNLPYSSSSTRCYIRFDATQIPSNAKTATLTLYCKRSSGHASGVLTEDTLYLSVFQSYCTNWSEDSLTWDSLVSGHYVGHYSYNGLADGFDWKKPTGTPSEWLNYNTRFYEVRNLVLAGTEAEDPALRDGYLQKAKELVLDFIDDAGANTPKNRALEPANRLIEFPFIYKHLVCGGYLTPDENIKMLSWLYDDTTDQYNGAYTLFTGANAEPKSNLPYTNWGLWHLTGFYSALCYFSEFADSASWRAVYDARLGLVMGNIIKEDGSYNEVTFGYPGSVISWCATLKELINRFGDSSANAAMFSEKMLLLTKYLVDCSLPNGKLPFWGEGGPTTAMGAVNTTLAGLTEAEAQTELAKYLRNYQNANYGKSLETMAQYDGIQVVTDRTGWTKNDSMIFMNAKSAGSHSHRDALALLLYYGGRSLLTDTGMTSYDGSHLHFPFQRSTTRSHNTVEVDGIAQTLGSMVDDGATQGAIQIGGNSAVSTVTSQSTANNPNRSTLKVEGSTTKTVYHSTTFTHSRDLSFLKALGSIVVVTDKVVPQDNGVHQYTQNWHCAPYSNPTLSKDASLTGQTAYSTGPNLIIAQAGTQGITASLQTGYDATTPATPTKYFEYKQSASGTVTYQTVLYPVAQGAQAQISAGKLSMSGTTDAQALAMEVAISDSNQPNLTALYHYHSFESTPARRSFGPYSTDAATAITALDAQGAVSFVSLAKGSSLHKNGKVLLEVSQEVSDLTALWEKGVLTLTSADVSAQGLTYQVNLDGREITSVLLNGRPMAFTQQADGTAVIRPAYLLLDFTEGSMAATETHWQGLRATTQIDREKGVLYGTVNGGDPNIRMTTQAECLGYQIAEGDIIEIRMKTRITEGAAAGVQVFFKDRNTDGYSEAYSCKDLTLPHATGRYTTIQLPFVANATYIGKTIDSLRLDLLHLKSDQTISAEYEVDYIYAGPAELAPSATARPVTGLYFGFDNKTADEERYAQEAYGWYPFDTGCWGYNPNRTAVPVVDSAEGVLSVHILPDNSHSYVQTSDYRLGLSAMPLYYLPREGDRVQVRLRFEHCTATTDKPLLSLYYIGGDSAQVTNDHTSATLDKEKIASGEYMLVEFAVPKGFTASACINALRFTINDVADDGSGASRILFDYFYVGSEDQLPMQNHLYFGFDNLPEDRERYGTVTYGGYNFDTGNWGTNVTRAQIPVLKPEEGILSVTITEGSNNPYFQTTTGPNTLTTAPLTYLPGEGDVVQLRVKFQNCAGSSPDLRLYYMKDNSKTVTSNHSKLAIPASLLDADTFRVFTFAVPAGFTEAQVINSIRITAGGVTEKVTGQARLIFDYIYIGSEERLPTPRFEVVFQNSDGSILERAVLHHSESAVYSGATPAKSPDRRSHYTFKGWDKPLTNVTEDTVFTAQFTAEAHAFTYSNITLTAHTATCVCGYSVTEAHSYTNGLCACGEAESKEPMEDVALKLSHSLNLASDISVNLAISKTALEGFDMETVYVESVLENGKTQRISPVENGNFYYFTVTGLTALHMNDRIRSVLYGTKNGQPYYSPVDDYAIADYAYALLNMSNADAKLKTLCADLLRYGAKAQIYKNYRTDHLADAGMTDAHKAYLSDLEAVTFGNTNAILTDVANAPIAWVGKTLNLESKVALKFVFDPANYTGDPADLRLAVRYRDINGNAKSVVMETAELYSAAYGYYVFTVDTLLAAELRAPLSVQIFAGDSPVSCTMQFSADTYGNGQKGALLTLCKALIAYSDSAKAYFTK